VQDTKATKLGRTTNFVPINFALAPRHFVFARPKKSPEKSHDAMSDPLWKVDGGDVMDCLGSKDGAYQHSSTGHVHILPISGGKLSGDFILQVLKVSTFEPINRQRQAQVSHREGRSRSRERLKDVLKVEIVALNRGYEAFLGVGL
jgi:hypothetical protein